MHKNLRTGILVAVSRLTYQMSLKGSRTELEQSGIPRTHFKQHTFLHKCDLTDIHFMEIVCARNWSGCSEDLHGMISGKYSARFLNVLCVIFTENCGEWLVYASRRDKVQKKTAHKPKYSIYKFVLYSNTSFCDL